MPSTTVYNMAGEAVEQLELSEQVFGVIPNEAVLHQVVVAQLVNRRQGTASTKTRSEVAGGGRKPYKQKGTGRARQGSNRAPQFRHGGVVWGPRPHIYHHDVPKKMRRLAIKSALSDKLANEHLIVLDRLALDTPRTKDMLEVLESLPVDGKLLMMLPQRDENIMLSTRNIPSAKVQHVSSINVVELLKHDYVIMSVNTVRWIELVFGEGLSTDEANQRIAAIVSEATEESEEESEETPETSEESSEESKEEPEETTETAEESAEESEEATETPEESDISVEPSEDEKE